MPFGMSLNFIMYKIALVIINNNINFTIANIFDKNIIIIKKFIFFNIKF